jgi:diguanylate cyclase
MQISRSGSGLVGAVGNLIGGLLARDDDGAEAQPVRTNSRLDAIDKVRAFVQRFDIDPSPETYAFLYQYCVLQEPGLDALLDKLLKNGYLDEGAAGKRNQITPDDLETLIEKASTYINDVKVIVAKSGKEASGFGSALEGAMDDFSKRETDTLGQLVNLTQQMIAATKAAESELRSRQAAVDDLRKSLAEARTKADTDALTGLSNRRAFERNFGAAVERCRTSGAPLSLAICDVDKFKNINDSFGHPTGDKILKLISNVLDQHCAGKGSVSRFGGEEFVVLFEGVPEKQAFEIIDKAREDLAERKIVKKETGESVGRVSFSAGIGSLGATSDPGELLKVADEALYAAKAAGRNCIIIAS